MSRKNRIFALLLFVFSSTFVQGQISDNIIWAGFKLNKKLSNRTSLSALPIFRINEDISNFQNWSIDIALRHQFNHGWSVQLLSRTWFIPDQPGRQFIWFDVAYAGKMGNIKGASSLRLHEALDINDRNDPDFIRWKSTLSFPTKSKFEPFLTIEPWFRLNDGMQLQRMRYEPGVKYKISSNLGLTAIYRREESVKLAPTFKFNMYVVTLAYNLPYKSE